MPSFFPLCQSTGLFLSYKRLLVPFTTVRGFVCYSGKHYGKAVDWMDATGKEVTLWQHMLERPNFWVEGCLTLRPSLEHRNSS